MPTTGQTFDIVTPARPPYLPYSTSEAEQGNFGAPAGYEPEPTPSDPEPPMAERFDSSDLPKPKRPWWRSRWAFIGAPGLVLLAGAAVALAYATPFSLSKTYLGTVAVSPTSDVKTLDSTLLTAQQQYAFAIAYPDKHRATYKMSDAGVSIDTAKTAADYHAKLRHAGFRRFVWWRPMYFTLTTKTDDAKLKAFMQTHASSANVSAVDAALSVSNGSAVITPAKDGSVYSIPGGKAVLVGHIARLKTATLSLTRHNQPAAIEDRDLANAKQQADSYLGKDIAFTVSGQTVQATPTDIGNWLDISPVPSAHTADVTVDSGKVLAYINKLSAKYVRPAVSEIQTTDAAGNVSVLIPGSDGIDVTNQADAAKQATNALQGSMPASIALNINAVAHTTVQAGNYDKWIIADLTTKRMYAYEHTTLVRSFLISAGAPKTPTVIGQYKIYSKYLSKDMRGSNADGSRYFQPHVRYVNFFYRDYAIHGNYWRPASYFGNINSSHGCIGIPDSDAHWLYDWAPIGTPVITHA